MAQESLAQHLWRTQKLALAFLLVSSILLALFAFQFARAAIYFNDPAHIQQPLEPWMTPRYVGRSYSLPPNVARELFRTQKDPDGERPTMGQIAREKGLTLPELEALVQAAADEAEARRNPDP